MRAANTMSSISDTLRDSATDATEHLRAAGESVSEGLRDSANTAAESVRQSARSAESRISDAAASGKELYRGALSSAGDSISGIDKFVSRNPSGALIAALGLGLVLGFMARR